MSELQPVQPLNPSPFKCLVATVGNIPTSFAQSLSYFEALQRLAKYIKDVLIPAVNADTEAIEELQAKYIELKDYVDHYFDNLDVQEEINNKLDDMAEAGTLQEIIGEYIHSSAMLGFDTVSAMKTADNLINGSFAQTLGYTTKNDGGACKYKIRTITNDDVIDEVKIIELADDTLIAEMIEPEIVTPEMAGCVGNGTTDDTANMQKLFDKFTNVQLTDNKTYLISSTITIRNITKITGNGYRTKIKSLIDDGTPIFYNNDTLNGTGAAFHFTIQNFYIDGNDKDCIGFLFAQPYDSCSFRDLHFANFKNSVIKCGNNSYISQSLVIDNVMAYTSGSVHMDKPTIELIKCYETNILNTKFLNNAVATAPNLKLENVYDVNIQGCSFTLTSDCAILITGNESRYNRIISNTYESITAQYLIKLDGTVADGIQETLIMEAGSYYNAPKKVYCNNEALGTIIGLDAVGGRRNIVLNANASNVTDPYGNLKLTSQGGGLLTRNYKVTDYNDAPKWQIYDNSSANSNMGLTFADKDGKSFAMRNNVIAINQSNGKLMLKSPNGSVIKYLGINNNGELYLANFDYE